ncbi:MAG: serine/threonine protein kinase [Verrucomicrobiae bacterium]|nr:serine/threonine protein kinase [Verrucomicrobiae bacterium]NNJ87004.1 serine/threonine protein kinase [Akkermansiaceae bacterium]
MNNLEASPVAITSPSPGELHAHLSAYDSIELLAVGGMGAVYKARQISLDRTVAIKVLTHTCAASMQFRQIFKCEAQVMAKLNHPNLVSIYDYGEVNGMLYIVMQFVEGRSLHEAANGRAVAQNESATLISKTCKALEHAHSAGILHRDIKPANILIDSKLTPVVVDFGLAHHAHESTMKGETVFGTPGYTAPEVLVPPYSADQRADVFSLGVLFHQLLTGQLPQTPYLPPSRLAPVDQRYDAIVMRAIHPTRAMRYSSCEAMACDLDKILSGKELTASPLLLTPAVHPQLARSTQPKLASIPSQTATRITPINRHISGTPAHRSQHSSALPSLTNHNTSNAKSMVVVLAACITLAMAVIALLISSGNQEGQAPVATGGLPSSSSATPSAPNGR